MAEQGARSGSMTVMTLIALFGAPAAWLIQMWLSEPLAAHACYPRTKTLARPLIEHLNLLLIAIGCVALVFGATSLLVAWRGRRAMVSRSNAPSSARFLFEIGLLGSFACVVAIIFTLAAALLVAPCQAWS